MIIYSYGETAYNKKVAHTLCVNFHVFQSPERGGGAWVCHQPGGGLGDKPSVPIIRDISRESEGFGSSSEASHLL